MAKINFNKLIKSITLKDNKNSKQYSCVINEDLWNYKEGALCMSIHNIHLKKYMDLYFKNSLALKFILNYKAMLDNPKSALHKSRKDNNGLPITSPKYMVDRIFVGSKEFAAFEKSKGINRDEMLKEEQELGNRSPMKPYRMEYDKEFIEKILISLKENDIIDYNWIERKGGGKSNQFTIKMKTFGVNKKDGASEWQDNENRDFIMLPKFLLKPEVPAIQPLLFALLLNMTKDGTARADDNGNLDFDINKFIESSNILNNAFSVLGNGQPIQQEQIDKFKDLITKQLVELLTNNNIVDENGVIIAEYKQTQLENGFVPENIKNNIIYDLRCELVDRDTEETNFLFNRLFYYTNDFYEKTIIYINHDKGTISVKYTGEKQQEVNSAFTQCWKTLSALSNDIISRSIADIENYRVFYNTNV